MKDMSEKEFYELKMHKMRQKRNTLFRAFVINAVAIFLVWLLMMTPFYGWAMGTFTPFTPADAQMYLFDLIGVWKLAGVVLFLVPALAIWWEMAACKKKM